MSYADSLTIETSVGAGALHTSAQSFLTAPLYPAMLSDILSSSLRLDSSTAFVPLTASVLGFRVLS